MSNFQNPGSAPFRDLPPGPHSGVPTDPDAHATPDTLDRRIRALLRNPWTAVTVGCVILAIFILLSVF